MPRTLTIVANWKMHPTPLPFEELRGVSPYHPHPNVDVVVFPTFLDIPTCVNAGLTVGAQYARPEPLGAFTGDISMQMVKEARCTYVLCGHSDRRRFHGESDAFVAEQVRAARALGLIPIVCIGETTEERQAGKIGEVLRRQLALLPIDPDVLIAYEPVWAISRGDPNKPAATTKDAEEMHALIRSLLPASLRPVLRIIYGGSMKAANAAELLEQEDIDGGLVGNASLNPEDFRAIVEAAAALMKTAHIAA